MNSNLRLLWRVSFPSFRPSVRKLVEHGGLCIDDFRAHPVIALFNVLWSYRIWPSFDWSLRTFNNTIWFLPCSISALRLPWKRKSSIGSLTRVGVRASWYILQKIPMLNNGTKKSGQNKSAILVSSFHCPVVTRKCVLNCFIMKTIPQGGRSTRLSGLTGSCPLYSSATRALTSSIIQGKKYNQIFCFFVL